MKEKPNTNKNIKKKKSNKCLSIYLMKDHTYSTYITYNEKLQSSLELIDDGCKEALVFSVVTS